MLHCHLVLSYLDPAGSALTTGLAMLANAGKIRLTQEVRRVPPPLPSGPWHLRDKEESAIELHVEGHGSAFVDLHDSWEVNGAAAASHDIYLKRSFDPSRLPPHEWPTLRPLGLISEAHLDGFDIWEARRVMAQDARWETRLRALARLSIHSAAAVVGRGSRPTLSRLRVAQPCDDTEPLVLFMAGVWDPRCVPAEDPKKAADFEALNEMRAECVRRLRRAFGERFYGGILHDAFAAARYPDVLLADPSAGSKLTYLDRVRRFPICVTTTGLHGSNGWKLAEYVGLARCIVSEPLQYVVPGDFAPGRNYLPFRSPQECVEQVATLMDSRDLRRAQMHANLQYYDTWMRPDVLARYAISTLLSYGP